MLQQQGLQFVNSSSQIHRDCLLDASVQIGAFTVIGAGVSLGKLCRIGPQCDLGKLQDIMCDQEADQVWIGNGVKIGARVSVHGAVEIGNDVTIGNNVTLQGPLQIGDRSEISDGAVIGAVGQFPGRHATGGGKIVIDADVTIREYVVINQPIESTNTKIGRHAYLMARSQIDHDCEIGDYVKFATGVTLGGGVKIDEYAYLGMNCVVHQGTHVGAHTMLGMNSSILKNVPPFAVVIGSRFVKINTIGLSRRSFTTAEINAIENWYTTFNHYDFDALTDICETNLLTIAEFYSSNTGKPTLRPVFGNNSLDFSGSPPNASDG